MVHEYDLLHLLNGAQPPNRWYDVPERQHANHSSYDPDKRARVVVYDAIPYTPGRNSYERAYVRIADVNGRVLTARAPLGATAPTNGAYVALWRASALHDYGELYAYVGVGIYTPDRTFTDGGDLIATHDEYVAPKRADELTYRPEHVPEPLRALLNQTLYVAWFNDAFRGYHPGDRITPTNKPTVGANAVTIVGAQ